MWRLLLLLALSGGAAGLHPPARAARQAVVGGTARGSAAQKQSCGRGALGSVACVATNPAVTGQAKQALYDPIAPEERAPAAPPKPKGKAAKKADKRKVPSTHGKPIVAGLSHKTATVEVREKLSILEADWNQASAALVGYDSIQEAAVLSTCNRFEVYVVAEDHFAATRDVMAFLRSHSGLADEALRPNLFVLQNEDAT